jgi:hypothetical protein
MGSKLCRTRVFGGISFLRFASYGKRYQAKAQANNCRRQGFRARVIQTSKKPIEYTVYVAKRG